MSKYERTGETTDDPAVAVGWGLWRSAACNMYRVTHRTEPSIEFQGALTRDGGWLAASGLGLAPYERMREAVEPRSGAELRRWMVAHPGVWVRDASPGMELLMRWSAVESCFQSRLDGRERSLDCGPNNTSYAPADGGGWDR